MSEFSFTSCFSMILGGIQSIFQVQGQLWDKFGVFASFMLVFVGALVFRFIVNRMFFGGEGIGADSAMQDFHGRQTSRIKELNRQNALRVKASRKGKK